MPCNGEIVKDVVDQFQKVQAHMKNAREENAAYALFLCADPHMEVCCFTACGSRGE